MKLKFRLAVFVLVTLLFNCENGSKSKTLEEFKFTGKGIVVSCNDFDVKLMNEALFSFEEDILRFYGNVSNSPSSNPSLTRAYTQFIRDAINSRVKYKDILSPHSVKIFEVLKSNQELWNTSNKLNYNHPVISCISDNIIDKNLQTTFKALLETNSLNARLIGPALQSNYGAVYRDKYLSSYLALEFYYGRLFDVDLSMVTEKKEEPKDAPVDFNVVPQ